MTEERVVVILRLRFLLVLAAFSPVFGGRPLLPVEQRIKKIVQPVPGVMGVAAIHIETNKRIEVNGDMRFPMASTYKVPIVAHCLSLVDRGVLNLDDMLVFAPEDLRRGEENFFDLFAVKNNSLPLSRVIQAMIEDSSNVATDKILRVIGGPRKVTQWLQESCHVDQISVDRTTLRFRADYSGMKLDDDYACAVSRYNLLRAHVPKAKRIASIKAYFNDERDTTTPCAMADFLVRMYQGKLVSASSTNFLLDCMKRCKWGVQRIKKFLPKGTTVWHKTGRMDGVISDVGIIELHRGKGHVALALYSNRSIVHEAEREAAMAKITKAVFDEFSKK